MCYLAAKAPFRLCYTVLSQRLAEKFLRGRYVAFALQSNQHYIFLFVFADYLKSRF